MPDTEQLLEWRVFILKFDPHKEKTVLTASR